MAMVIITSNDTPVDIESLQAIFFTIRFIGIGTRNYTYDKMRCVCRQQTVIKPSNRQIYDRMSMSDYSIWWMPHEIEYPSMKLYFYACMSVSKKE